ncbi:methylmalonyl Co-A mutase-associated GTPase MeaB [Lutibaculum baratangense]|uniref:Putative periplasmic protein kinase ArgK n=1 Tax=Lutibaculum baratangense AMV1 TaxID=631454 RepID=V4RBG3_9HYPH|nr:methylmalonyl Co-A mutase-associated GTPase MeaB [Lutibaculum baratangense]ESR22744.1 putative periplasmic protein kinase ArgK [Lutibaculum baratangense AMV1]
MSGRPIDTDDLARRLRAGERGALARAITLVESRKPSHRRQAAELLQAVLPDTGRARRIGITGVPGVGKSTTIEQLGQNLIAAGHRVAVLAVDPSSSRSGGSILGDKTRMAALACDERAFVRPSPSGGTLGGVAARTRESLLLCEAAGFDVVIVETVGTGQSEVAVADMVDVFVLLALPGAGDELQGIKKGVLELADIIAVNKADGDNEGRARQAAAELKAALHILTPASPDWTPEVVTVSGLANRGLDRLWETIGRHREALVASGGFAARRREQQVKWMRTLLEERLLGLVRGNRAVAGRLKELEARVADGDLTPALAVEELAQALDLPEATT